MHVRDSSALTGFQFKSSLLPADLDWSFGLQLCQSVEARRPLQLISTPTAFRSALAANCASHNTKRLLCRCPICKNGSKQHACTYSVKLNAKYWSSAEHPASVGLHEHKQEVPCAISISDAGGAPEMRQADKKQLHLYR